jgi:hypothetical protein
MTKKVFSASAYAREAAKPVDKANIKTGKPVKSRNKKNKPLKDYQSLYKR